MIIESRLSVAGIALAATGISFRATAQSHDRWPRKYGWLLTTGKRVGLGIALVLMATCFAVAQTTSAPSADDSLMLLYYQNPQPERLIGYLERYQKSASATPRPWGAYPPVVGFFAVVFREHPEWIERLLPARLDAMSAVAVDEILRLSGNSAVKQNLQARLADAGSDPILKSELSGLPAQIMDIQIARPTHLDIFWGAFFASGDERYVRKIIDFLARTADRSEPIAVDVALTTVAMSGGPTDIYNRLKEKYDQTLRTEVVFAATAGWALGANARRHEKVAHAMTVYISEHPSAFATKVLTVLRPR